MRALVAALAALLTIGFGAATGLGAFSGPSPQQIAAERAAERAAEQARVRARLLKQETAMASRAATAVAVNLPERIGARAPQTPPALFRRRLPRHLVLGYVPYWSLGALTPADYADATVLAYYGVTIAPNGSLQTGDPGWKGFQSSAFSSLVATAHRAGDRVLLTVTQDTPSSIAALLASPSAHAARLAAALVPLLRADRLDGIDIDIEGTKASERAAFVHFVADLSTALKRVDPRGELVLDTYPQSAVDHGFFAISSLAPLVSQLFVMGYDMQSNAAATPNAPLASPSLGLSDVQTLLQYGAVVSPAKLILGVPFYGYDFTTIDGTPGAPTLKRDPVAVTYAQIVSAAHPAYWDPGSSTPYTRFHFQGSDHQTWYDNPVSIALKTALAMDEHLAGVGAWAFGAEGSQQAMLRALDGPQPPAKLPLIPPAP